MGNTWQDVRFVTRHIRADHAPMRGKSRRERMASMSQTERDDLIPLARKVRADARRDALQVVVDAALWRVRSRRPWSGPSVDLRCSCGLISAAAFYMGLRSERRSSRGTSSMKNMERLMPHAPSTSP